MLGENCGKSISIFPSAKVIFPKIPTDKKHQDAANDDSGSNANGICLPECLH
jgi:hypothetical protein